MASPLAQGLFAKAIMQSGNCLRNPTALTLALAQGDRIAAAAGCANAASGTGACMRAIDAAQLLAAASPSINIGFGGEGEAYGASLDGYALTESPADALAKGSAAQVPFLLGVNDDETTTLIPASALPVTVAGYEALVRSKFPLIANAVLERYPPRPTRPRSRRTRTSSTTSPSPARRDAPPPITPRAAMRSTTMR